MNITDLAAKLRHKSIDIDFNDDSLNYPVLKFNIQDTKIKYFYRENFIKRSKFHKKYNTYFEITVNDISQIGGVKKNIIELLSCKCRVYENKIYINISKVNEDEMLGFINKFKE